MIAKQDIERLMLVKQQYIESFIESDDYDIDDDEEELIQLLELAILDDDPDDDASITI
jgi:hypothetical protein